MGKSSISVRNLNPNTGVEEAELGAWGSKVEEAGETEEAEPDVFRCFLYKYFRVMASMYFSSTGGKTFTSHSKSLGFPAETSGVYFFGFGFFPSALFFLPLVDFAWLVKFYFIFLIVWFLNENLIIFY